MKYASLCLLLFLGCRGNVLFAQFSDDFSNDNLHDNPVWLGDTSVFVASGEMLQLSAPSESGEKFIYTASQAIENAVWAFDVYFDFNPSSSNYTDIYLAMSTENCETASGYFVRIGNSDDEISLYRQDGAATEKKEIIDGADKTIDTNPAVVKVKVTRDKTGNWALFSDAGNSGNYTREGEVFDNIYMGSAYFGILCHYTSTRSDKFFFDNFTVTGNTKSDVFPPSVVNLAVSDGHILQLTFSEKININGETATIHFLENCNMTQPATVEILNDSAVSLFFENAFPEHTTCQLLLNNIPDRAQNILTDTTLSFQYIPPRQPGFNELLITEIMADPTPNAELPEYEYLELYNPLQEKLEVKALELRIRDEIKILDDFEIEAEEYIILCPNPAVKYFREYGQAIGVSSWKSLLNNGDTILLYNRYGEQVFSVAYQKDWHDDAEKSEGGCALEMIDTENPCGENANWTASTSSTGGTPGQLNAAAGTHPDLTGPEVLDVFPVEENKILVYWNEKILSESFKRDKISLTPAVTVSASEILEPLRQFARIALEDNLQKRQVYTLSIDGIKDCLGNPAKNQTAPFVLPEKSDSLDVVFNEILFNPVPAGVDFVELINLSGKYIDLQNWKLLREAGGIIEETEIISSHHLVVDPGEIIVLAEDQEILVGQYPHSSETFIYETSIPPMNDDEGTLILADEDDAVIDKLFYHEDLHHPMLQNPEGVSLERISYNSGSADAEVWQSAASTVGFATPGLKNSQFLGVENAQSFSIQPKVFVPDNDGYKDFTSISFKLNKNYLASLFIYDISGKMVKQLLNNQNLPSEGFVVWEGDDDQGNKVGVGNYIVFFELIGQNGERKIFKDKVAVASRF